MFFDQKLESAGGNPILKKLAVSKLIELKESYNLCGIWQIRNPKSKAFTLRFSNNMQQSVKNVKILNALSTYHSRLFCFFLNLTNIPRGHGPWKFSNSLILNTNFVDEMKTRIQKVIFGFENDTYLIDRVKWELLKHETQ